MELHDVGPLSNDEMVERVNEAMGRGVGAVQIHFRTESGTLYQEDAWEWKGFNWVLKSRRIAEREHCPLRSYSRTSHKKNSTKFAFNEFSEVSPNVSR